MIVLAESNFVLELALEQSEAVEVERFLEMAEESAIRLVISGFALVEPHWTLIYRKKRRSRTAAGLSDEIAQLSRSKRYRNLIDTSRDIVTTLLESGEVEFANLAQVMRRAMACASVEAMNKDTLLRAQDIQQEFKLGPHDAVVLASVEAHLLRAAAGEKIFINKNSTDFASAGIRAHLRKYDCMLFTEFAAARAFVEHELRAT